MKKVNKKRCGNIEQAKLESAIFDTDKDKGLNSSDVETRLKRFGHNEIQEKEVSNLTRFLKQFWGPIPWMIEIAIILSALVHKWEELIIIVVLLLINVLVGYIQESKALNAIKLLKQKLARKALVLRDGEWRTIDARLLVPGDIIKITIGSIIPADVKIIEGDFALVDESALTGESLPVNKKVGDVAYSNSIVKQGELKCIVTGTGSNTFFGKTVGLVAKAERASKSHFEKVVIRVGNYLILMSFVMIFLILLFGIERHEHYLELIKFSLVLAIAAIPIALPAVLTVTMAIGAVDLAKKHVIVTRLATIEELARMNVLCTDKTGTVTRNEMAIKDIFTFGKNTKEDVILYAAMASKKENEDPIEKPIFELLKKQDKTLKGVKELKFKPFDPVSKRTEATVMYKKRKIVLTKGAPQIILSLCGKNNDYEQEVNKKVDEFAEKGFRTLAVAFRDFNDIDFKPIGLIAMYDPPREDSAHAIKELKNLGVDVKMVTGDHEAVARYIAGILKIGDKTIDRWELNNQSVKEYVVLSKIISEALYKKLYKKATASQIQKFTDDIVSKVEEELDQELPAGSIKKHESEIIKVIENTDIFAEVFPEDKYFIVEHLQKAKYAVGMTGDGVNDAPALRKADVGIAVAGSTDAAKAAAALVLVKPGLSLILHAINVARKTFERMNSYTIFRIAETLRIIFFMGLSILIYHMYPLTAVMIIVLALLNDIPILSIAYDNTVVDKKPINWDLKESFIMATFLGVAGVVSSFTLLFILFDLSLPIAMIQSLFFAKMVIAGHGTIYNTRTKEWFWKKPYPSWLLFGATFSTRIIGTIVAVYGFGIMEPIGWKLASLMWAYALAWFVFNDAVKKLVLKFYYTKKSSIISTKFSSPAPEPISIE